LDTEPQGENKAPKGDDYPLPIGEVASKQGKIEPISDAKKLTVEEELPSEPAHQHPPTEVQITQQPLLVHVTKDDELNTFERRTVFFGIIGIFLATLSMVAAIAAGIFIYQQFKEMEYANTLSGISARRTRYDSDKASIATTKQLAILQGQLTQQTKALRMDERPWLKFEVEGEIPPGFDPNNTKTRTIPLTAGQPLKIKVKVTNIGKTTAENLLGTLFIQIVPKDGEPIFPKNGKFHFSEGHPCSPKKTKNIPETAWLEGTLYPKEVSENEFSRMRCSKNGIAEDDPPTQAETTAVDSAKSYVLIFGEVWYVDVFGTHHWTKFCEMANAQININLGKKCARFDAVDNNN
jgi:hypothetical protein